MACGLSSAASMRRRIEDYITHHLLILSMDATNGARTLRTGLLAVLLGAIGRYERSKEYSSSTFSTFTPNTESDPRLPPSCRGGVLPRRLDLLVTRRDRAGTAQDRSGTAHQVGQVGRRWCRFSAGLVVVLVTFADLDQQKLKCRGWMRMFMYLNPKTPDQSLRSGERSKEQND